MIMGIVEHAPDTLEVVDKPNEPHIITSNTNITHVIKGVSVDSDTVAIVVNPVNSIVYI